MLYILASVYLIISIIDNDCHYGQDMVIIFYFFSCCLQGFGSWCLTPLSAIFQLYRGG